MLRVFKRPLTVLEIVMGTILAILFCGMAYGAGNRHFLTFSEAERASWDTSDQVPEQDRRPRGKAVVVADARLDPNYPDPRSNAPVTKPDETSIRRTPDDDLAQTKPMSLVPKTQFPHGKWSANGYLLEFDGSALSFTASGFGYGIKSWRLSGQRLILCDEPTKLPLGQGYFTVQMEYVFSPSPPGDALSGKCYRINKYNGGGQTRQLDSTLRFQKVG
jgi:hypothetical protein